MSQTTHDFAERLAFSQAASDEPFWDAIYRRAFPGMVSHMVVTGNVACQRDGVDRVIVLANGKVLKVDEKKREREYTDILLEYISSDVRGTPGWIEKDLPIDYMAYAFMPTQTAYLFPWDMLRRAWLYYKPKWLSQYKRIEAQNNGYRTISVAVPIQTVKAAVSLAMVITLKDT